MFVPAASAVLARKTRAVVLILASISIAFAGVIVACEDDPTFGDPGFDAGTSTVDVAQNKTDSGTAVTDSAAKVEAGPDANGDGGCRFRPFGTPKLVLGLDGPLEEESGSLSADELTIIFSRSVVDAGTDFFTAQRGSKTDPFVVSGPLTAVNDVAQRDVHLTLSGDGLTMIFQRSPTPYEGILYSATRNTPTGTFSMPNQLQPFTGLFTGEPHLRADGKALYYVISDPNGYRIWRATSDGGTTPFGGAAPVDALNGLINQGYPVITADELLAFYAADVGGSNYDIFTASRGKPTDPFTSQVVVPKVSSSAQEYPVWLSPDSCRLYLASNRAGDGGVKDYDLYMVERE